MEKVLEHSKRCLYDEDDETLVKKFKLDNVCELNKYPNTNVCTSLEKTDSTITTKVTIKNKENKNQHFDRLKDGSLPSCSKILRYERTVTETENEVGIHSLSDEILLTLLSYLDPSDLYNLSRCSERLFNICGDKSLWNKVTATCNGQRLSHSNLCPFFHSTTSMRFSKTENYSDRRLEDLCFGVDFFKSLCRNAPCLRTFIIENHILCSSTFKLNYFPKTLTELRLQGTQLLHLCQESYVVFENVDKILPNLEIVDVSYSQWFHPHSLLPLGKCNHLRELRMTGCRNLKDFIPYASIAAAFGFKKLEFLDMRLTDVVDREITCFSKTKSLKHILLEKPEGPTNLEDDESITDICTTSLGMRNWVAENANNIVYISLIPKDGWLHSDYTIETLVVRNYSRITDITLKHAEKCLKSLKYLDVTGSNCTAEQVSIFKANRPEVKLLFDGIIV